MRTLSALLSGLLALGPVQALRADDGNREAARGAVTDPRRVFDGAPPGGVPGVVAADGQGQQPEETVYSAAAGAGFHPGSVPNITEGKVLAAEDKKEDKPPPPTDKKALWGAVTGVLAGALIGFAIGGPIGAAIGALVGLFLGALAGKKGWFRRR